MGRSREEASHFVVFYAVERLLVESLGGEELPDSVHIGVAAGSRRCRVLEAVVAGGKGVEVGLYAHLHHLFPCLHRIHGSPSVGVAVDEHHGGGVQVEGEFGGQHGVVLVSAAAVGAVKSVCKRIGGIDAHAPLHFA